MSKQKSSYERRQESKKHFLKVTVILVAFSVLLGIIGSAGLSAFTAANAPVVNDPYAGVQEPLIQTPEEYSAAQAAAEAATLLENTTGVITD